MVPNCFIVTKQAFGNEIMSVWFIVLTTQTYLDH